MPSKKIIELIKDLSVEDSSSEEISNVLLRISNIEDNPKKISESLIMLFSIIDTNNKKNKHVLVEILTVILSMVEDKKKVTPPKNNKTEFLTQIGTAITKAPVLFWGGTFAVIILILLFTFYRIDPTTTDQTIKSVDKITKDIKDFKGK